MYTGIGASAGIGIGSAVIVKEPSLAYDNKAVSDVDAEKQRLTDALDKCIAKTQAMADDMKERVGEKEAEILEGHVLLLMDPEMTGQMESSIADDKMCAEAAVEKICDYYMQMFAGIDDEMFQQRATDVCDIKTRLLKILLDVEDGNIEVRIVLGLRRHFLGGHLAHLAGNAQHDTGLEYGQVVFVAIDLFRGFQTANAHETGFLHMAIKGLHSHRTQIEAIIVACEKTGDTG